MNSRHPYSGMLIKNSKLVIMRTINNIKILGLCFLAFSVFSCDDDETVIERDTVGAYAHPATSITVLDQNVDIPIDLFTDSGVSFQSVEVQDADGTSLASVDVSGDVASFNSSNLGEFSFGEDNEPTGSFDVRLVSQLSNGKTLDDSFSIDVGHAISISEVDDVPFDSSSEEEDSQIEYTVETFGTTVDALDLEWKVGSEGTYAADDTELGLEGGSINVSSLDRDAYNLSAGDTLYYRFTASSGELMDQVETSTTFTEAEEDDSNGEGEDGTDDGSGEA